MVGTAFRPTPPLGSGIPCRPRASPKSVDCGYSLYVSCFLGGVWCVVLFGLYHVLQLQLRPPSHSFSCPPECLPSVETAQPVLLLSPGAVARPALAEHPIKVGCAVCCVAYAVCSGHVNPVWVWFVA